MGLPLALAVPNADMDRAQPGRRGTRSGAGQRLQAGVTQGPLRGGGGRGRVLLAAEAVRDAKEGAGTSVGRKCPVPQLQAPAGQLPAGRSSGAVGPWPLAPGSRWDRQQQQEPGGCAGNAQASESTKGMAENLAMVALSQYHSLP